MITVHGANTTIEQLRQVELKRPEAAGSHWRGIQHGELADAIVAAAAKRGWRVAESRFCLSRDEADLFGAFEFDKVPKDLETPEGIRWALGVATSNARRRCLRLFAGGVVEVCSNGLTTGSLVMQQKHVLNFDFVKQLEFVWDDFEFEMRNASSVIQRLKDFRLTQRDVDHLIMQAGRFRWHGRPLIRPSKLIEVDLEYRVPRFEEIGTGTSWALLNAFTYVLKSVPATLQLEQMDEFRRLLPMA